MFSSEEILDILEQFKCLSLVNWKNISEVVQELAKQQLCQIPHIMASCWWSIFEPLRLKLPGFESLRKLYQDLEPTWEKLVLIINSKPENQAERECLHYFKKCVQSLDKSIDEIKVSLTKSDLTFLRRLIAHTCGPYLELPSI